MKLGLGGRQQRLAELNNSSNEDSIVGEQCKTEGGCNTALDNDRLIGINVPRDTNCTYIFAHDKSSLHLGAVSVGQV